MNAITCAGELPGPNTLDDRAANSDQGGGTVESVVEDLVTSVERDGYGVLRGAAPAQAVEQANRELRRVLESTPAGRDDFEGRRTRRAYGLFAKTRSLDPFATNPVVLGVLDRVIGQYQLSAPAGIAIGPGEPEQVLHPDDAIYPLPRPHPPIVFSVMWPLDDFTQENGATRIVTGSHLWGERQPGPETKAVSLEVPAGDALFYTGSVWHGGGSNKTDRDRLGVVMHYCASWLRPVENHVLVVPPSLARTLPTRLQELLGYNIHPPFVGYVDGRHPKKLLEDLAPAARAEAKDRR